MSNYLESLAQHTVIVADTGNFEAIAAFKPEDATTNPSLVLKAAQLAVYKPLVAKSLQAAMEKQGNSELFMEYAIDKLSVSIGVEILKVVPGKISTEVDARLSFDTARTVERARKLISLYQEAGVSKNRILIKIAATWEGIQACEVLENEGIHTNMTLIFSLAQAAACAQAKAFLVSPFVGRIMDWHKANEGRDFAPAEDPGVISVQNIYKYFKKFGHETIVMGASFRSIGEITELCGCDRLTIAPELMKELESTPGELTPTLTPTMEVEESVKVLKLDEKSFRWAMNEDPMATEKLAEGIRKFAQDLNTLEDFLRKFEE
ncbi:MAG: transaldolase [SAR324 cluster bacterium]|nr:transaldolase [SAR324 cluster bacterium]